MSMSRPARLAAFSVLVLFLGCRSAHAAGWWDYLEALSGPGPFKGYGWFTLDVYCTGQSRVYVADAVGTFFNEKLGLSKLPPGLLGRTQPPSWQTDREQPCIYIDITAPHLTSEPNKRFPSPVEAVFRESGVAYRLLPALELGAGAGGLSLHTKLADGSSLD